MSPVLNSWSGAGGLCNCLDVLLAICIAGSALVAQPAAALAPAPYGEQFVRVGGSWPDGEAAPPGAVSDSIDPGANEQSLQRELLIHEQAAGPYADALAEPLASLGRQYSLQGDYVQAQRAYQRALHIVRVNDGLYSDRQLPVLKELLNTHRAVGDVQALDDRYEYIFRLYGSGQPPYTELRLGAAVEYLRWQREALRMGADKSDRTHSRLLAMFQLNQQLLDDVAADGNVAFAAYRELGLSQLRNLYLIQDRVQPRIETIGSAPEVPMFGADWTQEDFNKMRIEGIQRSALGRGEEILDDLIARCPPDDPEALARLNLELADWNQWNGRARDALEGYARVGELLGQAQRQDLVQLWLAQPVELPDNGAFWQPQPVAQAAQERILEASYDVSSGGRASNVKVKAVNPADDPLVSKLVRLIRQIRFRPRFVDGQALPDQLVRDYQLVR